MDRHLNKTMVLPEGRCFTEATGEGHTVWGHTSPEDCLCANVLCGVLWGKKLLTEER